MRALSYLKILYYLRENSELAPLSILTELADNIYGDYDIRPFIELYNENYIIFWDSNNNDISDSVLKMSHEYLRQMIAEKKIYIKLTNKLFSIQSLLGFSLNDTIRKFEDPATIMVSPTFKEANPLVKSDVFVIMPFQENFDFLYHNHIQNVCNDINLSCLRADDLYASRSIMQDIWSSIYNSKIIIADCSGKNPNVMYELGIAHAIGKNVILITQDIGDIPFDLRHLRYIQYEYSPQALGKIEDQLLKAFYQIFSENSNLVTPTIERFLIDRFRTSTNLTIWEIGNANIES